MQRWQYVRLEIKKALAVIFKQLILILLVLCLMIATFIGFYKKLSSNHVEPPISAALVIPGKQDNIQFIARILSAMDSIKNTVKFIYPDEEEARRMLAANEIDLAVFLGEDFYNDVNSGINTPVQVIFSKDYKRGNDYFVELLQGGMSLIDVTQAASYAMEDAYRVYDAKLSIAEMEQELMDDYVELAFRIHGGFDVEILSPTGKVSLKEYYITCAFLIYLLLLGIGFSNIYDRKDMVVEKKLVIYGVTPFFCHTVKLGILTLGLWLFSVPIVVLLSQVLGAGSINYVLCKMLFICLCLAAMFHGIFSLGDGRRERKWMFIVVIVIMLLMSGCIVPICYMPGWVKGISRFLPLLIVRENIEQALFVAEGTNFGMVIWALVFVITGAVYEGFFMQTVQTAGTYNDSVLSFLRAIKQGNIKKNFYRFRLFVKWQIKRKVPVVLAMLLVFLFLLVRMVCMPTDNEIFYYVVDDGNRTDPIADMILQRSVFTWIYSDDLKRAQDEVISGRALAVFVEGEIGGTLYTASVIPKVLVARETYSAYCFALEQPTLLKERCDKDFELKRDYIYDEVRRSYENYSRSGELFRIEYH